MTKLLKICLVWKDTLIIKTQESIGAILTKFHTRWRSQKRYTAVHFADFFDSMKSESRWPANFWNTWHVKPGENFHIFIFWCMLGDNAVSCCWWEVWNKRQKFRHAVLQ